MSVIYTLQTPETADFDFSYYTELKLKNEEPHVYPAHIHDTVEIYFLAEGDAAFMVEGGSFPLCAGEALLIKSGKMHHCVREKSGPHRHVCMWLGGSAQPFLPEIRGDAARISLFGEDFSRAVSLCGELERAGGENARIEQFSLILEFLRLLRRAGKISGGEEVLPPRLRDILNEMESDFAQIGNLDELAAAHFLSRSSLDRLFRNYLRTTPHTYLETRRMREARLLLRQGLSVSEAASRVGYPDFSHFVRLFRSRFGITPSAYRRSAPAVLMRMPYAEKQGEKGDEESDAGK